MGPEVSFASAWDTAWYPLLDGGDASSVGTLRLSVPAGYMVVADEGNQRSSPEEAAQGNFRFEILHPTKFSFAAGKFAIARRDGAIPAAVYLLRPRQNIERYLDGVSEILKVLAQEFGPFPFKEFTLVEVPRDLARKARFDGFAFAGGMVIQGNSFDAPDFSLVLPYLAHEIGHQWWPFVVRIKGPGGRYMSEALAQYASLRAVEALMGPDAAEQYRSHGFPEWGNGSFSGLGYLQMAAAGFDNQLGDLPEARDGQRLMYMKGFLVWDMLSREVGREKFRSILHSITRQYAFQTITWNRFWHIIQAGAARDLKWFYEQWFERTGAPDWQLTWKQESNTLRGTITQTPPYYRATIEVQADGSDSQSLARTVEIRGPRTEFVWPVKFRVESVIPDPHYLVLHWKREFRAIATAMLPYVREQRKQMIGQPADLLKGINASFELVPTPDLYGIRFMLEYRLAELLMGQNRSAEAKKHLELALANPTRCTNMLPWLYFNLARLAKEMNDKAAVRWAVNATISADAMVGGHSGAAVLARSLLNDKSKN